MPRSLRVFLCHASQDKPAVWKLYRYLKQHGTNPWLDQADLLPGENWETEIPRVLYNSDIIIVCLSKNSVDKEGYVQKEISFALDKAMEKPEGTIFVIPVKLEDCDVPRRLSHYQWVDLFRANGRERLLMGLKKRIAELGVDISPIIFDDTRRAREKEETHGGRSAAKIIPSIFQQPTLKAKPNIGRPVSWIGNSTHPVIGAMIVALLCLLLGVNYLINNTTFSSFINRSVEAIPTFSLTPIIEPTFTHTPTPTASIALPSPTSNPCYNLLWIEDVTIPDGTQMKAGEVFTKTWLVQNIGGCAWVPGFTFDYVGGSRMRGNAIVLEEPIQTGSKRELSVQLTVPNGQTGLLQSSWRMSDENGTFFGDTLSVNITVGDASIPAATSTP